MTILFSKWSDVENPFKIMIFIMLSAEDDSSRNNAFDFFFYTNMNYRIFSSGWDSIEIEKKKNLTLLILFECQVILSSLFWISWFSCSVLIEDTPRKCLHSLRRLRTEKIYNLSVLEFSWFCLSRLNVWSVSMPIGAKTSVNMSFENWTRVEILAGVRLIWSYVLRVRELIQCGRSEEIWTTTKWWRSQTSWCPGSSLEW